MSFVDSADTLALAGWSGARPALTTLPGAASSNRVVRPSFKVSTLDHAVHVGMFRVARFLGRMTVADPVVRAGWPLWHDEPARADRGRSTEWGAASDSSTLGTIRNEPVREEGRGAPAGTGTSRSSVRVRIVEPGVETSPGHKTVSGANRRPRGRQRHLTPIVPGRRGGAKGLRSGSRRTDDGQRAGGTSRFGSRNLA